MAGAGGAGLHKQQQPQPPSQGAGREGRKHNVGEGLVLRERKCNERFIFGSLLVKGRSPRGPGAAPHAQCASTHVGGHAGHQP